MPRSQRIGLIAAALVVAVGAFLLLKDGDDEESSDKAQTTAQTTTTETPTTTTDTSPETIPEPDPEPQIPTITVKNGKPVGGVEEIEVKKGDALEFRVKSDAEHEIHLHGYDIELHVGAGETIGFSLEAVLDGIFEVEIEDLKVPIAEVRVNP